MESSKLVFMRACGFLEVTCGYFIASACERRRMAMGRTDNGSFMKTKIWQRTSFHVVLCRFTQQVVLDVDLWQSFVVGGYESWSFTLK
jgi:hypothetical protein